MDFLEKDLEDIIYWSENDDLNDRGLAIYGKKLRQVRIGEYGICDLITWFRQDGFLYVTIYELKQKKLTIGAFLQVNRYKAGVTHYLKERGFAGKFKIKCVLVGRTIEENGDFCFVIGSPSFDFYTYSYNLYGMDFEKSEGNYIMKNPGFNV